MACVLSEQEKFVAKIFLHYTDIAIFVLGYFLFGFILFYDFQGVLWSTVKVVLLGGRQVDFCKLFISSKSK